MSVIEDILRTAGEPLHVNEIILRARRDHDRPLKRESIVSALTKNVLDGNTFARAGRLADLALAERMGTRRQRFAELAGQRAGDSPLQEKIVQTLIQWVTSGRD